ncbi:unnamed protein product [Vitrella brassicaformis CCMP3155]|uniref:Uncharacterized protein n=2 Tax=Vitrella brassicaformis TaxID=1169539 RepID=A0A0G4FVJ1_VITBC|nr:unnamed protein product [Vitrella brassicaformis CCMP3155]|eukprot:CEM18727.1 unnamed protein product [Vitrella brassicaformis CCMP3155]
MARFPAFCAHRRLAFAVLIADLLATAEIIHRGASFPFVDENGTAPAATAATLEGHLEQLAAALLSPRKRHKHHPSHALIGQSARHIPQSRAMMRGLLLVNNSTEDISQIPAAVQNAADEILKSVASTYQHASSDQLRSGAHLYAAVKKVADSVAARPKNDTMIHAALKATAKVLKQSVREAVREDSKAILEMADATTVGLTKLVDALNESVVDADEELEERDPADVLGIDLDMD